MRCAALVLFAFLLPLTSAQTADGTLNRIIAANKAAEEHLPGYRVTEHYQIVSPGEKDPIADAMYSVEYLRGQGKTYTAAGTPTYRKPFLDLVLGKMIDGQQQASRPPLREHVLITPANYQMTLLPTPPEPHILCSDVPRLPLTGTYAVRLTPREARPELIDGILWVDRTTLHTVRVEGQLSVAPSLLIGRPFLERDYKDIDGIALAYSSCQLSQGLLTNQLSRITYTGYVLKP